jgi:hypothetical protein
MSDYTVQGRKDFESGIIDQAWKDEGFKEELLRDPRSVISREIGQHIPQNINIKVLEETSDTIYFVLPQSPLDKRAGLEGELTDEDLEAVAGGDCSWFNCSCGCSNTDVKVEPKEPTLQD